MTSPHNASTFDRETSRIAPDIAANPNYRYAVTKGDFT